MKIEHCSFPNDESIIIFENQTWDFERGGAVQIDPPQRILKFALIKLHKE